VRQGMTTTRRRVVGFMMAAAAGVTVAAVPSGAHAHTELAGTVPAAGSVSKAPLSGVRLEFAAPVLPELTAVVVTRGATPVRVGEPVVEGSAVTATVDGATSPGEYTVAYRTVAADGHPITGSFSFQVAPRPASTAPARERRDDDGAASGTRRRGEEASTVADDAGSRDEAVTAADPSLAKGSAESASTAQAALPAGGEPIGLRVIGILGMGAAAVAVGAGLLRRRSLS
jgi:copper resistance protein C